MTPRHRLPPGPIPTAYPSEVAGGVKTTTPDHQIALRVIGGLRVVDGDLSVPEEGVVGHDIAAHGAGRRGLRIGDGTPFSVSEDDDLARKGDGVGLGLPRNEVKRAINVMLNAASWPTARGALIRDLVELYGQRVGFQVDLLRATIQRRFPALEPFWNTGYGVILQRIDAEICTRLQHTLRQQGVPCLSIHDSFIVPQSAGALTEAAMNEEFQCACQQLRAKR